MDKTSLFDRNVASARIVAEAGYDGMMIGKLDVIAGISTFQKFQLLISPIMPKASAYSNPKTARGKEITS